jgi:hypothetical protein
LSDNGPRKERKRIIIIIRRNGAKTRWDILIIEDPTVIVKRRTTINKSIKPLDYVKV